MRDTEGTANSAPSEKARGCVDRIPLSFSAAMPPMAFVVLVLLGVLLGLRWRRAGAAIAVPSSVLAYACSTPLVSSWLLATAAAMPVASSAPSLSARAIVLLAADALRTPPPNEQDWPGPLTLERMVKAADLARSTGLPILVTGGPIPHSHGTFAEMISAALRQDFGVEVHWREDRSRNTYENAAFSASILKSEGIGSVYIVAQDWDMPRALWAFENAGVTGIPTPAGKPSMAPSDLTLSDFFPSARGFEYSFYALHELMGLAYYRWRYGS